MYLFGFKTVLIIVLHAVACSCDVDTDRMKQILTDHFSQARHHETNPAYKAATMRFIRDQFQEMGLETHMHNFSTNVSTVFGTNIIGILKGRYFNTSQDSIVGVATHYDTMAYTSGVNDNGAAMVTMLQTAREITSNLNRNHTVLFIAFDFEESSDRNLSQAACRGLCGSQRLIVEWIPSFWTAPVHWTGIFVMDTVMNFDRTNQSQTLPEGMELLFPEQAANISSDGGRGDFLTVIGRGAEASLLKVFSDVWNLQGSPQFEIETIPLLNVPNPLIKTGSFFDQIADLFRSDHTSFWLSGILAVFLTDTANFRGYMMECYHTSCDDISRVTPDTLNFVAKISRSLISVLNKLSPTMETTPPSTRTPLQSTSSPATYKHSSFLLAAMIAIFSCLLFMKDFVFGDDAA